MIYKGKDIAKMDAKELREFRKEVQKRGAVDGDLYLIENGEVKVPYARIIIKNIRL